MSDSSCSVAKTGKQAYNSGLKGIQVQMTIPDYATTDLVGTSFIMDDSFLKHPDAFQKEEAEFDAPPTGRTEVASVV